MTDRRTEAGGRWALLALCALGLILLLPGNNILPLLDRDEPRFARATVEMIDRHEWVVPYFNGDYRFDKPVLTYWLMRGGYALLGVGEAGARLHSVLSAVALGAAIFAFGRRRLGARAGWIAGLGMLTCLQVQIHGRSAVADMPMVFFVAVAQFALWELLGQAPSGGRYRWGWFAALYLSLGLGFLAKGPIALIVPLITLLLWRWAFLRRPLPWRELKLHLGLPVTLLIMGAWGIPALVATHGEFYREGIGRHVVDRGLKSFNTRMFLPIYYPLVALVSLFPWSFFVRPVWRTARRERTPLNLFLVSWFLSPFLVFTFYATQLPHYILPGFPAFFLLLGQALPERSTARPRVAAFAMAWPLVALAAIWLAPLPDVVRPVASGAVLLASGLTAFLLRSAAGLAAGLAVCIAGVVLLGTGFRAVNPSIRMAREIDKVLPASAPAAFYRYQEPSLVFYSGRLVMRCGAMDKTATNNPAAFLAGPAPRALVVLLEDRPLMGHGKTNDYRSEYAELPTDGCRLIEVEGVNVGNVGRAVRIGAYVKSAVAPAPDTP